MSDCTYNRQELVNETIAGLTSKVNRFRDAVKDTTAARRDQKCRCRKEKAREVAALGKAMVICCLLLICLFNTILPSRTLRFFQELTIFKRSED